MENYDGKAARNSKRVLFTGNGELMIDNLIEHIPEQYTMMKCPPLEVEFNRTLESFRPHAIIVCLLDESRDMLRMYYTLEDNPMLVNLPVIVLGRNDDCDLFKKKVIVKNLAIFERPIDMERFLKTLKQDVDYYSSEMNEREKLLNEEVHRESQPDKLEQNNSLNSSNTDLRKSILVVDDDIMMLNVIKAYLQDLYDISVVPSGKLALKFLSKKNADLVLLDYMMPEMDGPAVLQQIRQSSPNPNIPVLFLTGVSDKSLVMRGLEYHPNGYLLKPTTKEILLEKVTEILLGL